MQAAAQAQPVQQTTEGYSYDVSTLKPMDTKLTWIVVIQLRI